MLFGELDTPPLEGRGRVVHRKVNDRTQNFGRERSERHSDADYAFLYNKVRASLVPLFLSEGNLTASQSDAWIRECGRRKKRRIAELKFASLSSANGEPPARVPQTETVHRTVSVSLPALCFKRFRACGRGKGLLAP